MTAPTVRRLAATLQLLCWRALFLVGEIISPTRAARTAARLWLSPPPRRPATSPPPGGTDFAIPFGADEPVRGTAWGDGPTVYFMHGWGGSGQQIRSMIGPLTSAGFRVVTFDAPGHGVGTRHPTHAGEFGRALTAVIAHHGEAHAIVAHSLGAVAVSRSAVSDGLRVGRLVLVAPLVDAAPMLDRFADLLRLGRRTRSRLPEETARRTGLTIAQFTSRELLTSVDGGSTLIVHDRQDAFTPFAGAVELNRCWSGSTLVPTDDLGHHRLLHDPNVVATVVQFLRHPDAGPTQQETPWTASDPGSDTPVVVGDR